MSWIVEAVSGITTKHMKGRDGSTDFEGSTGSRFARKAWSSARRYSYKRPKRAGSNTILECRWKEGIWLGRRRGSISHLVGVGREVVDTRAVQRRPREDRRFRALVEGILATPWVNPGPAEDASAPVILPPRSEPPAHPAPDGQSAREGPKQVYIRDADLETYGYTAGCRR